MSERFPSVFSIILYVLLVALLMNMPVNITRASRLVVVFYEGAGFHLNQGVVENFIYSLAASCFVHSRLVLARGFKEGWPALQGKGVGILVHCFIRLFLISSFCVLVFGALGENISERNISEISKTISCLIGAYVLGGWVWVFSDFVEALYVNFKRGWR